MKDIGQPQKLSSARVNRDNMDSNILRSVQFSMIPGYKKTQVPCKKRRFTETAEVRFLSVEEGVKLRSRTRTRTLSIYDNPSKCATTELPLTGTTTCNSSLNVKEPNGADHSMAKQGLVLGLSMEKGAEFGSFPRKEFIKKGNTSDAFVSAVESKASNGQKRHPAHNSAALPAINPQVEGDSPIHPVGSPTINPDFHKNLSNGPALEIIWKGNFEVLDYKFYQMDSELIICEGFRGHAAAIVSRKAHEFSKQIAGVMQFKLHPRSDFWPERFRANSPDVNDIALYFYPGHFERSRRQYSNLLKYIVKNDLVMRSQMGYVELLIFASTILPLESQKLKDSKFMWGVFQNSKGK